MPSFLGHPRVNTVTLPAPVYATWNPAGTNPNITLSNGNLTAELIVANGVGNFTGTQTGKDHGNYYAEFKINNISEDTSTISFGLIDTNQSKSGDLGSVVYAYAWRCDGKKESNNNFEEYGLVASSGSVVMLACRLYQSSGLDMADIYFGLNGVWFGDANPSLYYSPAYSGALAPLATDFLVGCTLRAVGDMVTANFGQDTFNYLVPSGFGRGWGDNISP